MAMKPFASYRLEKQTRPNGGFMSKDSRTENVRLSAKQRAELKALQAMTDSAIDYDDIPQAALEAWQGAVVARFYKPIKQQLTLRVDADVIAWLKAQGRGYQTRINDLLRQAMLKDAKH
jgi:uncharacterized protein (DUF4415 family)